MSIRSMTGQGVGRAEIEGGHGRITVEIRAVNHRYLDVRTRVAPELLEHLGALEERVRKSLVRGRVEVGARLVGRASGLPTLDKEAARAAFAQLAELRDELRPDEPVPLSLLATVPDLWAGSSEAGTEVVRAALDAAADAACAAVWEMREVEGRALAADLRGHLEVLERSSAEVRARVPDVVAAYREKLRSRIEQLLENTPAQLDEGRLEHEVAMFADRADIAEELSRLASHLEQADKLLGEPEARGKRLDFLLQEMSREVNTIGSKSNDAELAHAVVEMKAAVSRMREQAQNVL